MWHTGVSCGTACLCALVEHARINRRRKEVVGGSDRVDVTCQVQVHLLHWDDLQGSPRSATLLSAQLYFLTVWKRPYPKTHAGRQADDWGNADR